jgi:general secretion pathway protein A
MPADTLESLRMMSNLETVKEKLLQIVLVGQPEFERKLNMREFRQLRERLAGRSTILPLTRDESAEYVRFRLRRAGTDPASVFTTPALREIVTWSKGIPRELNALCDNALIGGFAYQRRPVTKKIVKEVIGNLGGEKELSFVRRKRIRSAAAALLLFLFLGITWFLPLKRMLHGQTAVPVSREQGGEAEAIRAVRPSQYEPTKDRQEREVPPRRGLEAPPFAHEAAIATKTVARGDTLPQLVWQA